MFQFYKADLKKIILSTIKVVALLILLKYAAEYANDSREIRSWFRQGYSPLSFYKFFAYFMPALIGILLIKLFWKIFLLHIGKSNENLFRLGINPNISHPCEDENDALLVKMGSLMSITSTGNGNNKKYPSFINCIEERNMSEKDARERVKDWLTCSYDIENKQQLENFITSLIDSSHPHAENNVQHQKELDHLYLLADKTGVQLNRTYTSNNANSAFNLQRAAMLSRWGVTLDWISAEQWNNFKEKISQKMQDQFESMDKFIHDYMLAVYSFHHSADSSSQFMIVERLYGLAELQKHNYFALTAEQLTQLKHT